jgi:hypothetical protein
MKNNYILAIAFSVMICFASKAQVVTSENFDGALTWSVVHTEGDSTDDGWTTVTTGTNPDISPAAGAGMAKFNSYNINVVNSYDLTSPAFSLTGGSYQVSLKMYRDDAYLDRADRISVYYNTSPTSAGGVLLGTINRALDLDPVVAANGWYSYTFLIPGTPTGMGYISLLATTEYGNNIFVDDVFVENQPTTAPSCATNLVSTISPGCGNFPTTLTWDYTSGATGYFLSIGTTSGGHEVLNMEDIGTSSSYDLSGTINTSYYWTLIPYNAIGSASGCTEQTFTTSATGCYCSSLPTSNDNDGITNVHIGTTDFSNDDVTYADFTATPVDVSQGLFTNVLVSFATGYTYYTNIWIDLNNDYDFDDAGELVYSGESTSDIHTTLDASFIMPASASLGLHTMRIGAADSGQEIPNPCYSDSYGVTLDFKINVVAGPCIPAAVTTSITGDCGSNQYFVTANVTNLGSGTPVISDGTNSYPLTATGTIQIGPYAAGTSATLNLVNGDNPLCDLPLGTFTYICPPLNDDCANAAVLTPTTTFELLTVGTNLGATDSSSETATACNGYQGGDIWYTVVVPSSGNLTIETGPASDSSPSFDTVVSAYSGTCGSLTEITCDDDSAGSGYSFLTISGQVPGSAVYLRVYEYNNDNTEGTFGISAFDAALATNNFNVNSMKVYPNPVRDVLNISNSESISTVAIYNVLGQEVAIAQPGATSAKIDVSALPTGTFFVKVTVDNQTNTFKIVKQ